jgi:hypothetical protein
VTTKGELLVQLADVHTEKTSRLIVEEDDD